MVILVGMGVFAIKKKKKRQTMLELSFQAFWCQANNLLTTSAFKLCIVGRTNDCLLS